MESWVTQMVDYVTWEMIVSNLIGGAIGLVISLIFYLRADARSRQTAEHIEDLLNLLTRQHEELGRPVVRGKDGKATGGMESPLNGSLHGTSTVKARELELRDPDNAEMHQQLDDVQRGLSGHFVIEHQRLDDIQRRIADLQRRFKEQFPSTP